jgi:hypothetical protein
MYQTFALLKALELCIPHQGRPSHPLGLFALHLLQHSRVAVRHTATHTWVEMGALPPHPPLQYAVQPCQGGVTGALEPTPD